MKVGIICAGDEELAPFLPFISEYNIIEKAMLKFYAGQIDGLKVVALFSGVCKVNAAIASQLLIDVFGVNIIINSGTAGAMETASIAHVCYVNRIPFISIRCITDTPRQSGIDNFHDNCAKASAIAKDITAALLAEINEFW